MTDHRDAERNRRSPSAKTRRRVIGVSSGVGAFLALGMTQLAAAPTVKADEFDAIFEPIINSAMDSLADGAAASAAASPFDTWSHALEQDWSALGQQLDATLNSWFNHAAAPGEATAGAGQPMSENLLVNPGFETADPSGSGYSGVTIPGWTETGTPTVIAYGTPLGYPSPLSFPFPKLTGFLGFPQDAPPGGGDDFVGGGPVATSSISQTVGLTGAGGTPYELSADLGGQLLNPSYTTVQVSFLNADGDVLGTGSLDPVTIWDRLGLSGFESRDITGTVPEGATSAQVTTTFHDENHFLGNYNGAYADNESFTVGDPSLTVASLTPPTSDVGHLDHVFLIYMENKGDGDIVGSPNAPYINSLINKDDFASNYFALSHPSDGNYIRVMGGSDFGFDYNPGSNVIPAGTPNLMQEMDQAGVSWADFAKGMPAPGTLEWSGNNVEPFQNFNYVGDNTPAYLQDHLFPQSDLAGALQNPSTFPNFAWIKPGEASNMEGPVDTLPDIVKFLVSDLTDNQYNVAAGDQYLQQTISTIENSPTWTDPNEKDAIFITWDEDSNEPSLGLDNQGNNVPMIVIPNHGAVTDAGMLPNVTTGEHYNEYDLMTTIEDALRPAPGTLAPLTDNDTYASPMNAFWK